MKKTIIFVLWACLLSGTFTVYAAPASDAVLLVAPSRYSVMQVAFDVARRYPTVMVSYQGTGSTLLLHVWDGNEWLPLPLSDYQSGNFLVVHPARVILMGDDQLLPVELRNVSAWCDNVQQLPALDTANLVNGIGGLLPFTPSDWRWFAGRYNLTLRNLNATAQQEADKESWYAEDGKVTDPPPGFFKYFTRTRRERVPKSSSAPALHPVEVTPQEVKELPAF